MAKEQEDWHVQRRHFVAVATSQFKDKRFNALDGVTAEIEAFRTWLCDPALAERAFEDARPELACNPTVDQVRNFVTTPPSGAWTARDAAIVVITTHGWVEDNEHWLAFEMTDRRNSEDTAMRTRSLVKKLHASGVQHLLLIIDTCFSGKIAGEITNFDTSLPKEWIILPGSAKKTRVGALSRAIAQVLREIGTREGQKYGLERYIHVNDFIDGIDAALGGKELVRPLYGNQISGPHVCLPNPHYRSETAPIEAQRHDLALLCSDVETHWGPRSRGVANADESGWLFSGRSALMRRLIEFTEGDPGCLLVAGGAGSGKSAALARLVTLSDPVFRATYPAEIDAIPEKSRPGEGAVDVAVLATGKNALEILTQICGAVGAIARNVLNTVDAAKSAWTAWIARRTQPLTIVIDALDEATNPSEIVDHALLPLLGERDTHPVRLIVGVRSSGGPAEGEAPRDGLDENLVQLLQKTLQVDPHHGVVRVDNAPWWVSKDLEEYIASVLLTSSNTPYRGQNEAAEATAGALADAAGTSFLVARLAASHLAAREEMVHLNDPLWREAISNGILGVFREDLHDTLPSPYDRERAVHLLRAVAFAYGRGLPWAQLWPLVANAVADDPGRYGDTDIAWLLSTRLGGYLVTDREDDVTVYRLFHDGLRTNLRENWRNLLSTPKAEADA